MLQEATTRYHESLPGSPAEEHLANRGLMVSDKVKAKLGAFRLGYVSDPLPGHDLYRGMLAIPYIRRDDEGGWSVVQMRFRCLEDHDCKGHGKYQGVSGVPTRLFNTLALMGSESKMVVTEGEIDALTASVYGIPAVGVPGGSNWKPHYREALLGYETVYVVGDGDDAGRKFADHVKKDLPNGRVLIAPDGEDVNSWITNPDGYKAFKERIK